MEDTSPVFEAPGKKRKRKTGGRVLGRGHHAELTLKLAILHVHEQVVQDKVVIKSKKRRPKGSVARTAMIIGVGKTVVQQVLREAAGGHVCEPEVRGPDPTDADDYCSTVSVCLVRQALHELEGETVPSRSMLIH